MWFCCWEKRGEITKASERERERVCGEEELGGRGGGFKENGCGVEIPMGLEASKGGFKFELVFCDLGNTA